MGEGRDEIDGSPAANEPNGDALMRRLVDRFDRLEHQMVDKFDRLERLYSGIREHIMQVRDAQRNEAERLDVLEVKIAAHDNDLRSVRDTQASVEAENRIRLAGQRAGSGTSSEMPSGPSARRPTQTGAADPPSAWRRSFVPN